ncbi:hypothetical protein ACFE04_029273 [Oxalis oulophora]
MDQLPGKIKNAGVPTVPGSDALLLGDSLMENYIFMMWFIPAIEAKNRERLAYGRGSLRWSMSFVLVESALELVPVLVRLVMLPAASTTQETFEDVSILVVNRREEERWVIEVNGAARTIYANEMYKLQVDFPENYPMEAPHRLFFTFRFIL